MRFTLHYRGELRANGDPNHKHAIRRTFHQQLKTLWSQKPLSELLEWLDPTAPYSLVRSRGNFTFVPLVSAVIGAIAELSVTVLRPEPPGGLITQGGDIDNRLKTLFDALTMPPHLNALPKNIAPDYDENPFFVLLEDDNLVISVSVRSEQLLEPHIDKSLVDVSVYVRTGVIHPKFNLTPFA